MDAIGEAHIDNALVDIGDTAGILALDTALLQVVPVGVLGNTLDAVSYTHLDVYKRQALISRRT